MEKTKPNGIKTIYNKIQDRLTKKLSPFFHAPRVDIIYDQLTSGHSKFMKFDRIENTSYDPRWLDEIEGCIPDIDAIIKNPKKVIENVSEVVPIELARKTNSDSVKHLATHSQYVKEVDEKGDVIPNKILNIRSDDFYQTYENRFIATLVRRLVLFVEKRYQIIITNAKVQQTEILLMKNKSNIDGKDVEIETKVRVVSEIEVSEEEKTFNRNFIKRIEEVRKYLLFFYNSEFMKMMKTEKNVRNPIIMTNIIRKNHIYNHCYRLYKFIEKFDNIGVEFKVEDKFEVLNESQQEELNNALMTSFLALRGHETISNEKIKQRKYKPRIITTIDEEAFVYGDFVSGPLEFVRVDDAHLKYLDSLINKDVPKHPTKKEKEFYADEIAKNKEIKEEKERIARIIKEKEKEAERNEKRFAAVIEERKREEEAEIARLKKEEEDRRLGEIEAARRALMGYPEGYVPEEEKFEPYMAEEETIEPFIPEEEPIEEIIENPVEEAIVQPVEEPIQEIVEIPVEVIKEEPVKVIEKVVVKEEPVKVVKKVEPVKPKQEPSYGKLPSFLRGIIGLDDVVIEQPAPTIKEEKKEPIIKEVEQIKEVPIEKPVEVIKVTPVIKEEVKVEEPIKPQAPSYGKIPSFVKGIINQDIAIKEETPEEEKEVVVPEPTEKEKKPEPEAKVDAIPSFIKGMLKQSDDKEKK